MPGVQFFKIVIITSLVTTTLYNHSNTCKYLDNTDPKYKNVLIHNNNNNKLLLLLAPQLTDNSVKL